jgi:hypothetical protein
MVDLTEIPEHRSGMIGKAGHDPESNTLHVQYRSGDKVYTWPNITAADHAALMAAPSMSKHLRTVIGPKSWGG